MEFWLLAPVGALNIASFGLYFWYGHLIRRSNEIPFFIIGTICAMSSFLFFIIGLIKLGLNSWEITIAINRYGYNSAALGILSALLFLRPFVYEFIHWYDPITDDEIPPPKIRKLEPPRPPDPDDIPPKAA